jgi:hypothetical protein
MPRKLVASDDFNRSNGAIGANWTESTNNDGLNIVSNAVKSANAGSYDNAMFWNVDAFNAAQWSKATLVDIGSGTPYAAVIVRANATDFVGGQSREGDPPEISIFWYNGGSFTNLANTSSHAWANNDEMVMEATGTRFSLFVNNILRISGTNGSAPSSGSAGISMYSTSSIMDNWSGGNLTHFVNSSGSGTAISVATSGIAVGDLVICVVHVNNDTTIVDNNGATPFTENVNDYHPNPAGAHTVSIFSRVFQTGDPTTFSFTSGVDGRWNISCMHFTGYEFDVTPSTTYFNNTNTYDNNYIDAPTITTGLDNALHIIGAVLDASATQIITLPAGYENAGSNGATHAIALGIKTIATAGATGAQTITFVDGATIMGFSFSVKPVSSVVYVPRMGFVNHQNPGMV